MSKRTTKEVAAEIAALKALKPVGLWARKTAGTIQVILDALTGNIDETSDEFHVELNDEQQMAAMDAINWMSGDSEIAPSKDFGELVE